mmetsp:Transcript_30585/g.77897  ORF Transcript_30585/g.77897 Transcript_30585/m.77897 type:complete len:405 (+) Transcript_30585:4115-5329(+)
MPKHQQSALETSTTPSGGVFMAFTSTMSDFFSEFSACTAASSATDCALSALQLAGATYQLAGAGAPGAGTPVAASSEGSASACGHGTIKLLPHHKTGTQMVGEAVELVNKFLQASGCPKTDSLQYNWGVVPMLHSPQVADTGECFLHMERDPYEMVVSGYLYHLTTDEPWVKRAMDKCYADRSACAKRFTDGKQVQIEEAMQDMELNWGLWSLADRCSLWQRAYSNGTCAFHALSATGKVAAPLKKESWQAYLNRVDVDSGLLANAMWFANVTFEPMSALHDLAAASSCSANYCLSHFNVACNETWREFFTTAMDAKEPGLSRLVDSVSGSCPAVSAHTSVHSTELMRAEVESQDATSAGGLKQDVPPKGELMQRLRELDSTHLDGMLAKLAAKVQCPISEDYK